MIKKTFVLLTIYNNVEVFYGDLNWRDIFFFFFFCISHILIFLKPAFDNVYVASNYDAYYTFVVPPLLVPLLLLQHLVWLRLSTHNSRCLNPFQYLVSFGKFLLTIELLLYASKNPSCYRSRALPEMCLVSSKSWKCSFAPCSPQHSNLVAPSKNNHYSYPNVHSYTLIYHIICRWDFSQAIRVLIC